MITAKDDLTLASEQIALADEVCAQHGLKGLTIGNLYADFDDLPLLNRWQPNK